MVAQLIATAPPATASTFTPATITSTIAAPTNCMIFDGSKGNNNVHTNASNYRHSCIGDQSNVSPRGPLSLEDDAVTADTTAAAELEKLRPPQEIICACPSLNQHPPQ